ncbi:hypothetical protein AAE478_000243 [Parahypoxylon ruwenzoriense]
MEEVPNLKTRDASDSHSGSAPVPTERDPPAAHPNGDDHDPPSLPRSHSGHQPHQEAAESASASSPSSTTTAAAAAPSSPPRAKPPLTFADLPVELREMVWHAALPASRVFNALVYASAGLKMQLLGRAALRMPLAHACAESRRVVRRTGYVLTFRDEDRPDDPGVWFHPRRDVIERTIWGPGDFWGLKMPD